MIIAFGCSVTHGADLVYSGQHIENVEFSYPNLIANALGKVCYNMAVCGNSNERIFHSAAEVIKDADQYEISAVIVGWTSTVRESWYADGRDWFFIPSWCATKKDHTELQYFKDYTDKDINLHPRICADEEQYLEPLSKMYDYLTRYKFDIEQYERKKRTYVETLRMIAKHQQVKLIETCCLGHVQGVSIDIDDFGTWRTGLGHPTKQDHEQIAQQILLTL